MDNINYPWVALKCDKLTFADLYEHYRKWALQIAFELIKFDNLPDSISQTFLKYLLYCHGRATFFRDSSGTLLALYGAPSNICDVYYIPTQVIVTNPYINAKQSYTLTRDLDCVVVYCTECDKYESGVNGGLTMLIHKFATMLADNDISINVAQKNTRLTNIVSADDNNAKRSVDETVKKMYNGDPTICVQSSLINTLQSIPIMNQTSNTYLVQLVELRQYILSQFYASLGIYVHDNMKRERLITDEITDGDDMAYFNIENIFESISDGIDKVNQMFGTNITVSLNRMLQPEPEQSEDEPEQSDEEQETTSEDELEQSDKEQEITSEDEPEQSDEEQEDEKTIIEISDNVDSDIVVVVGGDNDDNNAAQMGNSNGGNTESVDGLRVDSDDN